MKKWTPSRPFVVGCVTGAVTITLLSLIQKYYRCQLALKRTKSNEYKRLLLDARGKTSFQYQEVRDSHVPLCLAINVLIEYLPGSILRILITYVPDLPEEFDAEKYLENAWEISNDKPCDTPDLFVENVLPIPNQPTLYITIGLPGAGKTTWARLRMGEDRRDLVIAADDYFDIFNGGEFDPKLLGKAHEWAQSKVEKALFSGQSVVANNTNTMLSEMNAYVAKVVLGELPHKVVFALMPERNLDVLCKRGLHGVPMKSLKDMNKRMTRTLKWGHPTIERVMKAGGFTRPPPRDLVCREVIYTGIFTDDETKKKVREYFVRVSGLPLKSDVTDIHCTLKFQPLKSDVNLLPFGKKVKMRVIGYAVHKWIQTAMVEILDDEVRTTNELAHITISFNRKRIGPQFSNELLKYGKVIPVIDTSSGSGKGGLVIEGTVGAFGHGGARYFKRSDVPAPKPSKGNKGKKGKNSKKQKGKKGNKQP